MDLEEKLPKEFIPIHQSFVINRTHVARYAYEMVEMDNGTVLSISKAYRKQVRERLLSHLSMIFDAKWQNFCVRKIPMPMLV